MKTKKIFLSILMFFVLVLNVPCSSFADNPYLVTKINCSYNTPLSNMVVLNGILFFDSWDYPGGSGKELWKSDGTAAGTVMVKDINKSGNGSSSPSYLTEVNGTLFFKALTSTNGTELWKSDGTEEGTVMVKDIQPGVLGSNLQFLTNVNGILFFRADDGVNGMELWRSDGTDEGTFMVKDIYIGSGGSDAYELTNVNGTLFFRARDEVNGYELWKSDGTEAGTVMVKNIYPGMINYGSPLPNNLTNVNGTLFFKANDGVNGDELWKSDGTEAGTVMVKDIWSGSGDSSAEYLTNVNGTLFFQARDDANGYELWKSDGTEAGTIMVKNISPGSGDSSPRRFTDVNGTLFFTARDSINGVELWKSDGTEAGTVIVKDIRSGYESSLPDSLTNVGGTLFFQANDGINGSELWKSDGTTAGTIMVKDYRIGEGGSCPVRIIDVNGLLYFLANDGMSGHELCVSDGTDIVMVKDSCGGSSFPSELTVINGVFFFSATDGINGEELWKSDGTDAGTVMVKDIYPGSGSSLPEYLTVVNGTLYFSARNDISGKELWRSDGTEAGTVMVKDIYPGDRDSHPRYLTKVNGTLFFVAVNGINGRELWKSDGTTSGTIIVKDIYPGINYSALDYLTNVNGTIYFNASDGSNGYELWKSDGTDIGTTMVKDICPGDDDSRPRYLTEVDGILFFRANDGVNGHKLWKSDGTDTGTVMINKSESPIYLTDVNGVLFFASSDDVNGCELWQSDGTENGTVMVKDINPGNGGSVSGGLTIVNDTLFFRAFDPINGIELWKSDGTEAGTILVKDVYDGSGSSFPTNLTNVNGTLFFSAKDGVNGYELWQSDGTEVGTFMVKDINSGSGDSNPNYMTEMNDVMFFQANDGPNGYELWAFLLEPEIEIEADDVVISHNGGFDYGLKTVGSNTDTVFTIKNTGTADLMLTALPLIITGADADQFAILTNPAPLVYTHEATSFTIRFNPTSEGIKNVMISIANNDSDEAPYNLVITGEAECGRADMISPIPYSVLTETEATFNWSFSCADQYWLLVGTSIAGSDLYSAAQGTGTSASIIGLPYNGGKVYVRLYSLVDGLWWYNDYTYDAFDYRSLWSVITSPAPCSELNSRTVTFTWSDGGADQYWLQVGTTLGGDDIYSKDQGSDLTATVNDLPHSSETVYVRLWQKAFGEWFYDDYTYTAFNDGAVVEGPVDGSTLTSTSATFTWNASGATQYWLQVGTTKGGDDIYSADQGTNLSATIDVQKHNGETLYVRLWSKQDGDWVYRDYIYTACNEAAVITSPVHGSDLNSVTQIFTWNDANAAQYWLQIGTSIGAKNIYDQDQGTRLTTEVSGLPFQGETLYARLWSKVNGDWIFSDSIYYAYDYNDSRASMITPAPGSTLASRTVTFTWTDSGAIQYWLQVGTTEGGDKIYSRDQGTATFAEVSCLPHNGETVYVRLWQKVPDDYWSDSNEDHWSYKDYTYTALNQAAIITDPAPGSTFTDTSPTFTWTDVGADQYWLWVGTSKGAKDLYNQDQGINTSVTVNNMPFNGQTLYVRLWSKVEGDWIKNDYVYTACNLAARMISPTPDSTFASTTQEFIWEDVGAEQYWLYVGLSPGAKDIYSGDQGTDTSVTVSGLPNNGQTVYVRLYSQINTQWIFIDYTYTARNQAAPILTPAPGSSFASMSVEFTWEDAGAQQYWLYVGTSVGGDDLYSGDQGLNTSATVSNLPHNSETVYVRIYSMINTKWIFNDYTYTACNDGAMITSPVPGSTLDSDTVVFTWNDVDATQYWLQAGTTQGGSDLYSTDQGRNTSATVTGLPHNGETVYVRLYSKMNGVWIHNAHTYTAHNDAAVMLTPSPGSTFDSSTVTFIWQDAEAEQYWLYVGTTIGASDLYNADQGVNTSVTVWGLPHNGETVYVRLYSLMDGDWIYHDYTYMARML